MEIVMFIGNEFIDSVSVEKRLITLPGYLGDFIKYLKTKHQQLILQTDSEPEFLLQKNVGTPPAGLPALLENYNPC